MFEIVLVRHGKSSWEFNVSDDQRPLKSRGYKDVSMVASAFKSQNFTPEIILTSPAKRAKDTAEIFIKKAEYEGIEIKKIDEMYDFSGNKVIKFVKSMGKRHKKIMLFGHNNAFTSISNTFGSILIDNLPTSGLVHMKFNISEWSKLQKGETILTIFPRDLKNDKR